MAEITAELVAGLPPNGPTDPIAYYRRPVLGWIFRERINQGLRLLDGRRYVRALEVGYGSGVVLAALHPLVGELHGLDLDADPARAEETLRTRGATATLVQGSVYDLPYPDGHFDLVASFSTFEHLHEYPKALAEVARVLRPGGQFLLGMPSVNRWMEVGFVAIGFRGINDHHVTTPQQVAAALGAHGLTVLRYQQLTLPVPSLPGAPVYHTWLLERAA